MCGISGIIAAKNSGGFDHFNSCAIEMAEKLDHRGPDDKGVWSDHTSRIFLSHARLSVVDLSESGQQPMLSRDERWVISYNGEIYNCDELKGLLGKRTESLRGHSDTEVLIESISLFGVEKTLSLAIGMFAFAVWDRREKELWIARDRFGEKPLYYGSNDGCFAFASELKAFRAIPGFCSDIDPEALNEYFVLSHIPAPKTIFSNISKLPPGSYLKIDQLGVFRKPIEYWSPLEAALKVEPLSSDESLEKNFVDLFDNVVLNRMVSDVPIGAFLSGGIDSSAVVASMQRHSSSKVKTFTIGFPDRAYDESKYARQVADVFKTDHTELFLTPKDLIEVIPSLGFIYDEPFADSSQIPTLLLSQLTKKNVTVALSGDGGDELFGGYERYDLSAKIDRLHKILPKGFRSFSSNILQSLSTKRWNQIIKLFPLAPHRSNFVERFGHRIHKAARTITASDFLEAYYSLISLHTEDVQIVLGEFDRLNSFPRERFERINDMDPFAKSMLIDTATYLPNDLLTKVDRASMSVSLEVRAPFLDPDLYAFAWSLNKKSLHRHNNKKWLLKKSLENQLPEYLINRQKMGFGVPVGKWLRNELKPWADDLLEINTIKRQGFLNATEVSKKWDLHCSGKADFSAQIWSILMFQSWLEDGN